MIICGDSGAVRDWTTFAARTPDRRTDLANDVHKGFFRVRPVQLGTPSRDCFSGPVPDSVPSALNTPVPTRLVIEDNGFS